MSLTPTKMVRLDINIRVMLATFSLIIESTQERRIDQYLSSYFSVIITRNGCSQTNEKDGSAETERSKVPGPSPLSILHWNIPLP